MRIRTMAGLVVAATATAGVIAGGVAYAAADDENSEPIVRIVEQEAPAENAVQQEQQPRKDCPETADAQPSQDGL
jgi:hypothetical protein